MARSYELTEALSALIARQPFFAVYMLDMMEIVETESIPTAATDSVHIFVNPGWFNKMTIKERMFVLCHEILHGIMQHPERMGLYANLTVGPDLKSWNQEKFNHAADYVINQALVDAKVGDMPIGGLINPQITAAELVDDVYQKIPDPPPQPPSGQGGNWDHHMPANANAPPKAAVQRAMKSAEAAAKAQGNMPAGLQRIIDDFCEPQVPWQDHLKKSLTTLAGKDQMTWARPNRRRLAIAPHVYFPGRCGHQLVPVAVEIDTSGSISQKEITTFLSELAGLLEECKPEMIYVMYVDAARHGDIHEVTDLNELKAVAGKAGGGGGTDMTVVFREIEANQLPVGTAIIFTDGYTPFGSDPGYPVIWCITNPDIKAPFGTTVHVKIKP
jgi:predicted metal-dependent peptidase